MKKKVFDFNLDYQKAIEFFNCFGFCIFKNIVSLKDIDNVNKEIQKIVNNQSLKHLKKNKSKKKETDYLLLKLSKKK